MFLSFSSEFKKYKDSSYINLNNGTLGLCPDVVIDQQKAEIELFEANTSVSLGKSWQRLWGIQESLGQFLQASPQDLFLRPNVTLALNEIIMGLNLPAQSEILTTNFEYGAVVNILKYKCSQQNLKLRFLDVKFLFQDLSEEEVVNLFIQALTPQTKVLVVSHIFTGNGICLPLGRLAKALRKKEVLLVVDGAHAPGLIDLDFEKDLMDVDYYAGNLHKWFMGPKGTAFGWVHPQHQEKTYPLYGSWTTDEKSPPGMQAFAGKNSFAERMLWSHSQSFSAYYGLEAGFNFWAQYTKSVIFDEIEKRMLYLQEGLKQQNIFPLKELQAKTGARLLCYHLEAFPKASFEELFLKNSTPRLQVGLPRMPECPVLRLTPHIHNTQHDLDQAIKALSALV